MKVAVVIGGITYLKIFGSFLKRAHDFGIEPVILFWPSAGGKSYDWVTKELLEGYFPEISSDLIVEFHPDDLLEFLQKYSCEAVLHIAAYKQYYQDLPRVKAAGITSWRMDHFVNAIYEAAKTEYFESVDEGILHLDGRMVATEYWRDLELAVRPNLERFRNKYYLIGTPFADVYEYIDSYSARQILGIRPGDTIITVFTPNVRKHHSYYIWGIFSKWYFRNVFRVLRRYCDNRGYKLVIKSRDKQWDTPLYYKYADYFISEIEEAVYPYTSALLISQSKLVIHFGSMVVLEAASANIPSLGISVSAIDRLHAYMSSKPRAIIKRELFGKENGKLFAFTGVSEQMTMRQVSSKFSMRADSLIVNAKSAPFDSFRAKYIGASDSCVGTICSMLKKVR